MAKKSKKGGGAGTKQQQAQQSQQQPKAKEETSDKNANGENQDTSTLDNQEKTGNEDVQVVDKLLDELDVKETEGEGKSNGTTSTGNDQVAKLESTIAKQNEEIERLKSQLNGSQTSSEEVERLNQELKESEQAREESEEAYDQLLEKISHIKKTLGAKLQNDSQELENLREELEKRQEKENGLESTIESLKRELIQSSKDQDQLSHELSEMRKDSDSTYTKWQKDRGQLMKEKRELNDELQKEKAMVSNLEIALREEKSRTGDVSTRISDLEDQVKSQTEYAEQYRKGRDELKTKLIEVEGSVSTKASELDLLSKELQTTRDELEKEVKALKGELETKNKSVEELAEKNSQVPKLEAQLKELRALYASARQQSVILGEQLTRTLKNADDNAEKVDRSVVSSLFLSFLGFERGNTKKFEVLEILSKILDWDDEQKAQAGLIKSYDSGISSPRRSQSSTNVQHESSGSGGGGGGFFGRFTEFLERETMGASKGN